MSNTVLIDCMCVVHPSIVFYWFMERVTPNCPLSFISKAGRDVDGITMPKRVRSSIDVNLTDDSFIWESHLPQEHFIKDRRCRELFVAPTFFWTMFLATCWFHFLISSPVFHWSLYTWKAGSSQLYSCRSKQKGASLLYFHAFWEGGSAIVVPPFRGHD